LNPNKNLATSLNARALHQNKLTRDFFDQKTRIVAQRLLGTYLVRRWNGIDYIGRIVETEAYLGAHDLACHSARGRTARTEVMFGPPGFAYVYMIYGMHFCLNVVTEPPGTAAAVLIRALQPIANISLRTAGPALLCKALQINRNQNGHDLTSADFFIAHPGPSERFRIVRRPRIGVQYAGPWAEKPLRFYISGNPYVSRK
jgi:DNA-3-methyladenine glycosylase